MRKILALMLTSFMLVTVLVGCGSNNNRTEEVVLATSGEDTLLLRDYLYFFGTGRSQQELFLRFIGFTDEEIVAHWQDDSEGVSLEQMLRENSLQSAKDNATLLRIAKDAGYTYDPDELREREEFIDQIVMSLNSADRRGEDIFFDFYMITPQDFKDMQKDMLTIEAYMYSLAQTIPVSDEEVRAFYEENQASVESQLHMHATVRHVLIATDETMTEQERAQATQQANEILRRVEAGEDIGELAAMYSDDPGSADNNGEYEFHRGVMVPEFEEWAFSAQPGDIGMVESQFGYHIMYSVHVDTVEDHFETVRMIMREDQVLYLVMQQIEDANMVWEVDENVLNSVTIS